MKDLDISMTDAPENNNKAVCIFSVNIGSLENKLLEALSKVGGAVFSLQWAGGSTVSEEQMPEHESAKPFDRLAAKDWMVISTASFWCMIEVVIFLLAAFICICAANARFIHDVMLWKMLGYTVGFLIAGITLAILVCHKLKQ